MPPNDPSTPPVPPSKGQPSADEIQRRPPPPSAGPAVSLASDVAEAGKKGGGAYLRTIAEQAERNLKAGDAAATRGREERQRQADAAARKPWPRT
jgi:hypothetical protein